MQTAQLAPHVSCSLAQIVVNNYAWQAYDTHSFKVNDTQSGCLHNLNHMYIRARAIRRLRVVDPKVLCAIDIYFS